MLFCNRQITGHDHENGGFVRPAERDSYIKQKSYNRLNWGALDYAYHAPKLPLAHASITRINGQMV